METRSDLLFGQIAVLSGYCSQNQVETCVEEQEHQKKTGTDPNLGELMLRMGMLDFAQVNTILRMQHFTEVQNNDRKFGRLAVRNGLVSEENIKKCLARQDNLFKMGMPVPRLGEMLLQEGCMTEQEMNAILAAQKRLGGDASVI